MGCVRIVGWGLLRGVGAYDVVIMSHLLRGDVGQGEGRAALVHDGAEVLHHGDEAVRRVGVESRTRVNVM